MTGCAKNNAYFNNAFFDDCYFLHIKRKFEIVLIITNKFYKQLKNSKRDWEKREREIVEIPGGIEREKKDTKKRERGVRVYS